MSQEFWWGAGAVLGTSIVSFCGWVYFTIRDLQSKVVTEKEAATDAKIVARDRALSPAELEMLARVSIDGTSKTGP